MAAPVISHQRPHRKRGAWRRFGAPAVTLAGVAVATWLAPYIYPPLASLAPEPARQAPAPSPKIRDAIKVVTHAEPVRIEPVRTAPRRRPATGGQAESDQAPDELEVLSPAELDAISQARD